MLKITFLVLFIPSFVFSKTYPKIGIIGGGIAGTSCAYFLNEFFQNKAYISLFERDRIGGRLRVMDVSGNKYEAGGSVIHPSNQYMVQFSKLLGLGLHHPQSSNLGIYNGEKFVFEESDWYIITIAKMIWRYGFSVFSLFKEIKSMLDDFSRIYSIQQKGYAFTSVAHLLDSMNPLFCNMTRSSIGDILAKKGYSGKFLEELVQSIMMVNYGQTNNISGFAGFVSLAGADNNLWSIEGGNYLVPEGLLEKSEANLINGNVLEVILLPNETFSLKYQETSSNNEVKSENFDIVILSAPLIKGNTNIKFVNLKNLQQFERTYLQIVTTFVKGTLNPQAFHKNKIPSEILTNNNTLLFNSIGKVSTVSNIHKGGDQHIYKLFSHKSLEMSSIEKLFQDVQFIEEKVWLAYPYYKPPEQLLPFILHSNLYYTNAIEVSASAMEMSAISAKNVALLIFNSWKNSVEKIDSSQKMLKDEL